MPRRQSNPYAPMTGRRMKTGPARLAIDAAAQPGEAPGLRGGRAAGVPHRRAGQRGSHRQSAAAAGHLRRLVDGDRLAAGGVCHDQRLHQPAAGEISSAVRAARLYRRLSGALCAGHLLPPVRQRSQLGDDGPRRPRHGGRGAQLAGDLLSGAGLARTPPP